MSNARERDISSFDRTLLRCVERMVPSGERRDWLRTWHAELWYVRHSARGRHGAILADLSIGLIRDALWMRTESCRRTLVGTATLCLCSLAGLNLLAALLGLACSGDGHPFLDYLGSHAGGSMVAGALVVFVSFSTSSRGHTAKDSKIALVDKLSRHLLLAMKVAQVLLLAFMVSADLSKPVSEQIPNTSDFFQILEFVLLALGGLRWALRDQELRCRQCLYLLTTPARIGRPSRNLLEWNGSEMSCKRGHGFLSVAEMETSWCEASKWIECVEG